jgi:hypothetical protein
MKRYLLFLAFFSFLALLSGAVDGLNQTLLFHYSDFAARFPSADPYWWNPDLSWENKYCEGCGFLRRTLFVLVTDGYHLTRTFFWLLLSAASFGFGFLAPAPSRADWYWFLIFGFLLFVSKMIGFSLIYTFYF